MKQIILFKEMRCHVLKIKQKNDVLLYYELYIFIII